MSFGEPPLSEWGPVSPCGYQTKATVTEMGWDDRRLETEFMRVCEKLDGIDALLRGNGGPGVLVRVEKLELRERIRSKALWLVSSVVLTLVVLLSWELIVRG